MYRGKDIIKVVADNDNKSIYIRFNDGAEFDIMYADIPEQTIVDESMITGDYEEKVCNLLAIFVNLGIAEKRRDEDE